MFAHLYTVTVPHGSEKRSDVNAPLKANCHSDLDVGYSEDRPKGSEDGERNGNVA
jgi:hypothetical protein